MRRDTPTSAQERRGCPAAVQSRFLAFGGTSYDTDTRTIEAVLATGVRVQRFWWSEELDMAATAIDLGRVAQNQCRFLFGHDHGDPIGVVEQARLVNGELVARLRFAQTPRGDELAGMVQRGELTGISIGYQVRKWTLVEVIDGDHEIWRATEWELLEASLVTVPADPNAGVRSAATAQGDPAPETPGGSAVSTQEEDEMRRSLSMGGAAALLSGLTAAVRDTDAAAAAGAPASASPPAASAAPEAERASPTAAGIAAAELLQLQDQARAMGVETQVRTALENPNATRESVMEAILGAAAVRQGGNQTPLPAGAGARDSGSDVTNRNDGIRGAMLHSLRSASGVASEPAAVAQPYLRHSISELAAVTLGEREMPRSAADRVELFARAFHSTSDFPILLGGAMNTRLQETYQAAQPIYRRIAQQMTFADFRAHDILRPGDFPTLKPVSETGEIKFGTFGEKKESITVGSYGIQFGLSRQLLVNDHLGAIDRILSNQGTSVGLFEEFTFFAMKLANAGLGPKLLETGETVFHATKHRNLAAAGSAITEEALSAGRASLRKQKNMSGVQMGLPPAILLVSPDKETEAEKAIGARPNGEFNPFQGKLRVEVGGQLSGNAWELYADQAFGANWTWGLLDGFTAPRLTVETKFGQQGVAVSLEHDFGCGAQDYRYGYRNPGE